MEKKMAEHNDLGKKGEELAVEYLKKKGFKIKHTNWRFIHFEIDIIAEDAGMLVVAEVKTRTSLVAGPPEAFVTRDKQKKLIAAANAFIRLKNLNMEVRFDIISVVVTGETSEVTYIPDAFYPMMR
jgi:putative endonuclease